MFDGIYNTLLTENNNCHSFCYTHLIHKFLITHLNHLKNINSQNCIYQTIQRMWSVEQFSHKTILNVSSQLKTALCCNLLARRWTSSSLYTAGRCCHQPGDNTTTTALLLSRARFLFEAIGANKAILHWNSFVNYIINTN